MKRTILKLDPIRLALGQKCYCVLIYEYQVLQIEDHRLPRCLDDKHLFEVFDIFGLHSAAGSEHHLTVC